MTQIIEYPNIPAAKVVTPGSRYLTQKVIYYGEQRFMTFDTYVRKKYVPSGQERLLLLTKGLEFRPDLVSFDFYGFPDNWWRILEANNIKDIWDFKAGLTILIPDQFI